MMPRASLAVRSEVSVRKSPKLILARSSSFAPFGMQSSPYSFLPVMSARMRQAFFTSSSKPK
eukprot:9537729-Alexandrium_andersonii.AAC.1